MKKKILSTIIVVLLIVVLIFILNIIINKPKDYTKSAFVLDSDNKYKITTNMKWMTMQNDGGSHINIYYQIDFNENRVIKCEDKYVGFKGYEYEGKILYSKEISEKEKQKLKSIFENISNNSEESERSNFDFYILSSLNHDDIRIYDKDIINNLRDILEE